MQSLYNFQWSVNILQQRHNRKFRKPTVDAIDIKSLAVEELIKRITLPFVIRSFGKQDYV